MSTRTHPGRSHSVPPSPTDCRTDPEALAALQREHGRALFGFLFGLCNGDAQRAEDLVQETLVRAWQHPEVLESPHASMRPWLFTVGRRLAIDARRARLSRPQEVEQEDLDQTPAPRDGVSRSVTAIDVRRAVGGLGPEHREVLMQVYFRDRSVAEAAEELGIPTGTVKSRTYYALRALRKDLQGYGLGA
ncbi:sigma-70 family RNA polymerase sigma factor [Streptomyces sp. NPDC051555]|uniref:sigma-70 family RNA polymerase sigma factor n=1 Tax=Streptomyces sp. NPDC051555 TaxID=3365657 RepID=UPI00378EFBA5